VKWGGRELKDLGCPPDLIKFFVEKEFDDTQSLLAAIQNFKKTPAKSEEEKEIDRIIREDPDCAFQFLWQLGQEWCLPWSMQTPDGKMSKRELRQLLEQGAIRINHKFPKPHETVVWPVEDLVFFPGAKRQTTLM
jgi:hypothetical protein